jgi:hypothetical protein
MARKRSVDTATTAKTEAVMAMLPRGLQDKEKRGHQQKEENKKKKEIKSVDQRPKVEGQGPTKEGPRPKIEKGRKKERKIRGFPVIIIIIITSML